MRRLFTCLAVVTLLVLSFPAFFSSESRNLSGASPVAFAGRAIPHGTWCECGTANCECDPGEVPCTACPNPGLNAQPPAETEPAKVDPGAGITLIVAAVLLVLRLRQIY